MLFDAKKCIHPSMSYIMVDIESDGPIPGDYKSLAKDTSQNFKHLRRTKHTHHPVDDAKGNAEALLTMRDEMGLKIRL